MKNNTTIFLIILGIIIVIGIVVATGNKKNNEVMQSDTMTQEEVMMNDDEMMQEDEMMKSGSYESYSPDKLVRAETEDVVLFFRAPWCPTCRALDANIRTNIGAIPEGVTILDVDYDTETALKQKYKVTYQHTLVQVDADGNLITKWTGSPTLASLVTQIQ